MKDKIFLDTNIIVYAHDRSSREKHVVAREIMDYLWESRKGLISVQVLIIQAAIQGQACILLSEDLPDGQLVMDLKILNPFTKAWKDYLE